MTHSRDDFAQVACKCELRPVCCEMLAATKVLMTRQQFAVVVCEDSLSGGSFQAVVDKGTRERRRQPVIVVSSRNDREFDLLAMPAGVYSYVPSSSSRGKVERILTTALAGHRR